MTDLCAQNLRAAEHRTGRPLLLGRPLIAEADWPDELADQACLRLRAAVRTEAPATVIVIGSGGGAILDAIEREWPSAEVLLIEPDPGAAERLLNVRDLTGWFATGRLHLFVGPEYAGASGDWRPDHVEARVPVTAWPVLASLLPRDTDAALDLAARLVAEARANVQARRAHAARYLVQTLSNAAAIAHEGDVRSLFGALSGSAAIVVGAGPSLDGHLATLKQAATRAVVIACAAAARPLMLAGISPQFIVAADPSDAACAHLLGLPERRRSWLVAEGSISPPAFAAFEGRCFVFNVSDHHPWPWLASAGLTRGRLATWGSGASSALDLALRLGCTRVLLAGMDFAFTAGRTYCRGTSFESQWAVAVASGHTLDQLHQQAINRWPLTLEPDAEGHLVRTAPHLVAFRNWMRERISLEPRVRFTHVTPGGILHHPCLLQTSAEEALADCPALALDEVERELRVRHAGSVGDHGAVCDAIDRMLTGLAPDPRPTWSAFTDGVVREPLITKALLTRPVAAWRAAHHRMPAP